MIKIEKNDFLILILPFHSFYICFCFYFYFPEINKLFVRVARAIYVYVEEYRNRYARTFYCIPTILLILHHLCLLNDEMLFSQKQFVMTRRQFSSPFSNLLPT